MAREGWSRHPSRRPRRERVHRSYATRRWLRNSLVRPVRRVLDSAHGSCRAHVRSRNARRWRQRRLGWLRGRRCCGEFVSAHFPGSMAHHEARGAWNVRKRAGNSADRGLVDQEKCQIQVTGSSGLLPSLGSRSLARNQTHMSRTRFIELTPNPRWLAACVWWRSSAGLGPTKGDQFSSPPGSSHRKHGEDIWLM